MTNMYLDPKNSPDQLEDGHPGVRRMNKIPIAFIVFLVILVISAVGYAAFKRIERQKKTENAVDNTVQVISTNDGTDSWVEDYEYEGTIPAEVEPSQEQKIDEGRKQVNQEHSSPMSNESPIASYAPIDEAAQKRQERAQKIREDLFRDAVVSSTSIDAPQSVTDSNESKHTSLGNTLSSSGDFQQQLNGLMQSSLNASGGQNNSAHLSDPNLQSRKGEFQATERTYGYSTEYRREQLTPYEIRVGTVIPAVMVGGINSDLPGQIIAQVSQNVRDTQTGRYILIPQGSKLIGTYDSHIAMGQRRVMVGWHRIQFPDGSTLELGNMSGADQAGYSGFKDKVNNHYWRIFGNATLLSLISAGAQISQPESNDSDETSRNEQLAAEIGRQWSQVGQQMVRRNLNIQPTLEIRPGYRFNVMVNKDLILEPSI